MCRSIVALVALASLVLFVDSAKAGEYTYLQRARGEMLNASQVLQMMGRPFHGHREAAIDALKAAMLEVDAALQFVGITTYLEAPTLKAKGKVTAEDRLTASLTVIRQARDKLSEGGAGFGTHRVKAIKQLDVAIGELEAALGKRGPGKAGKAGKKRASKE
jgi:hypothetical protein